MNIEPVQVGTVNVPLPKAIFGGTGSLDVPMTAEVNFELQKKAAAEKRPVWEAIFLRLPEFVAGFQWPTGVTPQEALSMLKDHST